MDPGQAAVLEEDLAQEQEAADLAAVGREPVDLALVAAEARVLRLEGQQAQELDPVEQEDSDPGQVAAGLAQDREAADLAEERVTEERAPEDGEPLRLAVAQALFRA